MTDFLDYEVATVGVANFPLPVTGLTSGDTAGGLASVYIAPAIALHVPAVEVNLSGFTARQFLETYGDHAALRVIKADQELAKAITVFDLIAVLHFCLAAKRDREDEAKKSIQILLNARKDLIDLVRRQVH